MGRHWYFRASSGREPDIKNTLGFLLPSLVGILTFLTPIRWSGNLTIGISIVVDLVKTMLGAHTLKIVIAVFVMTSILTVLATVFKVDWIRRRKKWKDLFDVPVTWLVLRQLGTLFGLMYLSQVGAELWSFMQPSTIRLRASAGASYARIDIRVARGDGLI